MGVLPSSFLLALLSMCALIWQIPTKKSTSFVPEEVQAGEAAQCGGSSAYTMLILAGVDGSRKNKDSAWRTSEERGGAEAGEGELPLSQYCEVENRWGLLPHSLSQEARTEGGAAASPCLGSVFLS